MGHHGGESLGVHYVVVGRSCNELTRIKEGLVTLFATLLLEVASIPIKSVLLEFSHSRAMSESRLVCPITSPSVVTL